MKFSVTKETLAPLVSTISAIVVGGAQVAPQAILAHILLKLENGNLSVTANNGQMDFCGKLATHSATGNGEFTLPGKQFSDICNNLPDGTLIEVNYEQTSDTRVKIVGGKSKYVLAPLSADEFPSSSTQDPPIVTLKFSAAHLCNLLDKTEFAIATKDARQYLNGMLWETLPQRLTLVATDGHRMAVAHDNSIPEDCKEMQAILAGSTVRTFNKLLHNLITVDDEISTEIHIGERFFQAEVGAYTLRSNLIEATYPEYERVIPRGGEHHLKVNCSEFANAINRTMVISDEQVKPLKIDMNNERVMLSITGGMDTQHNAEEQVEAEFKGKGLTIGVNGTYLKSSIEKSGPGTAQITFIDADRAMLIEPENGDDIKYVVMPLRL